MTGALAVGSPLQALTPPRAVDELSEWIDAVAPVAIHQNARVWDKSVPATALDEYPRDLWQRSILFMNVLRQRVNQHEEMLAHRVTSALVYDSELVMRGDGLPHPVNYSLVRIIPPEGVEIDDRKRPAFFIDSGAGQGTGIGGLVDLSEIGDAFRAGHPVYFVGFTESPTDGQRIEDVARAFTIFLVKVGELHPDAVGNPFVFGHCQAGWHAMLATCMRRRRGAAETLSREPECRAHLRRPTQGNRRRDRQAHCQGSTPHEREFVFARGWSRSEEQGRNRCRMRAAAASKGRKEDLMFV